MSDLIGRLRNVKTMPELDAMRVEVVREIRRIGTDEAFEKIRGEFMKAGNRLRRIPLKDRSW